MDDNKVKKLSDEESTQINGGMVFRTASDSDFLKLIGMMDESFSTADLLFDWESCSAKVDEGWAKLGITCVTIRQILMSIIIWEKRSQEQKLIISLWIKPVLKSITMII